MCPHLPPSKPRRNKDPGSHTDLWVDICSSVLIISPNWQQPKYLPAGEQIETEAHPHRGILLSNEKGRGFGYTDHHGRTSDALCRTSEARFRKLKAV